MAARVAANVPEQHQAATVPQLPEEVLLRCLQMLAVVGSHHAVVTSCRTLNDAAKDDALWLGRLARDFPLASRAKPQGKLWRAYRILAKSQVLRRGRRGGIGIGPAGVFGDGATTASPECQEAPVRASTDHQAELRSLAARFAEVNVDIEQHVDVRSRPVVIAPRDARALLLEEVRVAAARREDTAAADREPGRGRALGGPTIAAARGALMEAIRARGEAPTEA